MPQLWYLFTTFAVELQSVLSRQVEMEATMKQMETEMEQWERSMEQMDRAMKQMERMMEEMTIENRRAMNIGGEMD